MAIPIDTLIKDPSLIDNLGGWTAKCCYCGIKLSSTITGKRKTPGGIACDDCYYGSLGEAVEQHPIASGRVRRG